LPSQRRRRNASPGFIQIDPKGHVAEIPEWPLTISPSDELAELEAARWAELWELPQAVEWERMRCYGDVALYVRTWVVASLGADAKLLAEVRQLDAKIGVSPKAIQGLRWEIPQHLEDAERAAPTLQAVDHQAYVPTAAAG
jgi:hypothetical protein